MVSQPRCRHQLQHGIVAGRISQQFGQLLHRRRGPSETGDALRVLGYAATYSTHGNPWILYGPNKPMGEILHKKKTLGMVKYGEILLFKAWGCLGRYVFRCFFWVGLLLSDRCWTSSEVMGQSAAKLRPRGSPKHHRNRRPNPGHRGPTEWPDLELDLPGKMDEKWWKFTGNLSNQWCLACFCWAIKPLGFVSWALLNPSPV